MKHSAGIRTVLLYLVAVPTAAWLLRLIPGVSGLGRRLAPEGQDRPAFWVTLVCFIVALVAVEAARRMLLATGHRRTIENSLPAEKRSFSLITQLTLVTVAMIPLLAGALLFDQTVYRAINRGMIRLGGRLLWLIGALGDAERGGHYGTKGGIAFLFFFGNILWLATPFLPRKAPKDKVYQLEMYNPFLAGQVLFSKERFILRYLRKLCRVDYLNRFSLHTLFAGRVGSIHNGIERAWYVTYDERNMRTTTEQRMLTPEHFHAVLATIRELDVARHGKEDYKPHIASDIVLDVAREFDLKGMAEQQGKDTSLGDLTAREVELIVHTLARSSYNDVLTLDVADLEDERPQQTFNKRLAGLVGQANRRLMRLGGSLSLDIYRRDKSLSTKVLQFRIDPQESLRRSVDEYGEKLSPRRSLLYATIRGAAGEHGDVGDDDDGVDADDFDDDTDMDTDTDTDQDEGTVSSASTLDHVEEVNPSAQQKFVQGKGFGRVYDIQLGRESYQVITEWLRSLGSDPITGWRPIRMSKVIDSDGNVVALRRQRFLDFLPHLAGLFGLGKEFSHVRILDSRLHGNDKFAMVLLALDVFESREFRNRKRILKTAPVAEGARQQPEE